VIGLVITLVTGRALASLLFGVSPTESDDDRRGRAIIGVIALRLLSARVTPRTRSIR